jgi:hypothetical protein
MATSAGSSSLHFGIASGQRVWNLQPGGNANAEGTVPVIV